MIQKETQDGSNWEYLCNLLKSLLTIPHDNLVGRSMWRLVTTTVNRIVTSSMKESVEELSSSDLLDLIGKKQILDEKYHSICSEDAKEESYRLKIHELQDKLDHAGSGGSCGFLTKVVQDLLAQVEPFMTVKDLRQDETVGKYFEMCAQGIPMEEVLKACREAGVDERVVQGPAIVLTPKKEVPAMLKSESAVVEPTPKTTNSDNPRNNPEYKKWFKLLDMGIPRENLITKMQLEGVDPSILDAESTPKTTNSDNPRNNPEYKKWFKLLDMGIPRENLITKMQTEGIDPSFILEASPLSSPSSTPAPTGISKPQLRSQATQPPPKPAVYNPPKEKQHPEVRMKNLYWEPVVGEALRNSFWESLHDADVQFNRNALNTLFRAKENLFLSQAGEGSHAEDSAGHGNELIQLITDDKRLRNVGMSIARLKTSYEGLCKDILQVNDTVLTQDVLRMLIENAPTEEEVSIVSSYTGSVDLLGEVDRFFKTLSVIPQLSLRLNNLQLRLTMRDDLEDLKLDFESFKLGMQRLLKSKKLEQLLEAILAIGNYMNGTVCNPSSP